MVFVQECFGRFRIVKDIDDSITIEANYQNFKNSTMIIMSEQDAMRLKKFLNEKF